MTALADKIRFAEKYITAPDGEPFSLEGRSWVVDEFWRPLDGWKLWPVDDRKLCAKCGARANTVVEQYTAGDRTRSPAHAKANAGCRGLESHPILITALNLKRQTGKSFNAGAWALAKIFKEDHQSVEMVAGAEDQVGRIFAKNYKRPIKKSPPLAKRCQMRGTSIKVPRRNSDLEIVATSISAVGDTRTVIIIEEARSVPAKVAAAVIPTLFSRGGWECPFGHVRTHKGVDNDPDAPKRCSVCRKPTQPWYGKTLILSSAGELQDDENDWFAEFVEHYTDNPHRNVHVFRSQETLNPKVSKQQVTAFNEIFGALESTRAYASIEGENVFRRKGEPFMGEGDITRIIDPRLGNEGGTSRPCVAFFDTSQTVEKTTWVIVADDDDLSSSPWDHVYTSRIDIWLPKDAPMGIIDDNLVFPHLELHLPMFPNLRRMLVDTRGRPWAVRLVKRLKALRTKQTAVIEAVGKHDGESQQGWAVLEQRILAQTTRLMNAPGMLKEFRGVIRKYPRSGDAPPTIQDRDRRKSHRDITESIAMCHYLVALEQLKGGSVGLAAATNTAAVRVDRQLKSAGLEAIRKLRASRSRSGFVQTRGVDPDSL